MTKRIQADTARPFQQSVVGKYRAHAVRRLMEVMAKSTGNAQMVRVEMSSCMVTRPKGRDSNRTGNAFPFGACITGRRARRAARRAPHAPERGIPLVRSMTVVASPR